MSTLRDLQKSTLATILEDPNLFGEAIYITYPDGEQQTVYGQITHNSQDSDGIWTGKPTATVRIESLSQTIDPSKPLFIRIPDQTIIDGDLTDYICEKPLAHGKGHGILTFHLTKVDQSA